MSGTTWTAMHLVEMITEKRVSVLKSQGEYIHRGVGVVRD